MSQPLSEEEIARITEALDAQFNFADHVQAIGYAISAKSDVIPGLLATIAADRERIAELTAERDSARDDALVAAAQVAEERIAHEGRITRQVNVDLLNAFDSKKAELRARISRLEEALREVVAGEDEGIRMKPRTPEQAVKAARRVTAAIEHARTVLAGGTPE